MKIVITQPNYLPWLGYFAQLQSCDLWVVLDDVQYTRREWQNRNRIVGCTGEPHYITLPIKRAPRTSLINQISLSDNYEPGQHLAQIERCYMSCQYYADVYPILSDSLYTCYAGSKGLLSVLNVSIIRHFCALAGFEPNVVLSSELPCFANSNSPTQRLCAISRYFNASTYLSSPGAKHYMLNELGLFESVSIAVAWQKFDHIPYPQRQHKGAFLSHISFIDYLFNCGLSGFGYYLQSCHSEVS
jgi:hypothetical protein